MSADERCRPLLDDNGQPVASVRGAGTWTEEDRGHMLALIEAAQRRTAAEDAADPERVARRERSAQRIRERNRRLSGEDSEDG